MDKIDLSGASAMASSAATTFLAAAVVTFGVWIYVLAFQQANIQQGEGDVKRANLYWALLAAVVLVFVGFSVPAILSGLPALRVY